MRIASSIPFCRLTVPGVALLALASGGCESTHRRLPGGAAAARQTIPVGEIAIVDEEKRFVLIDLGSNLSVPSPGAALRSINAAGQVAHLKAAAEQKRPFIAADIVAGEPAVGDRVVR